MKTEVMNYVEGCDYMPDDWIYIHTSVPEKYRVVKYKHFSRLRYLGNKIKNKIKSIEASSGKRGSYLKFSQDFGCDFGVISNICRGFPNVCISTMLAILKECNYELYISIEGKDFKTNPILLTNEELVFKLSKIGSQIKKIRTHKGISLSKMSKQIGISRPTLMKLEAGYEKAFLYYYLLIAEHLEFEITLALNEHK